MYKDVFDRHRSLRILVGLLIATFAIYVLGQIWSILVIFGDVILLFLLSWIIAFVLEPLASFLQRWRLPRLAAISLVYLAVVLAVSGAVVLVAPTIETQIKTLATQVTTTLSPENLPRLTHEIIGLLERLGLSNQESSNLVTQVTRQIPQAAQSLSNSAVSLATGVATSIVTIIFNATLVAIISFYMMTDGARLVNALIQRLPPSWRPYCTLFQGHVQDIFAGFFRAQLIVAALYGAGTWAIMAAMGLTGGLLAAILSAVLMLLPFLGAFLAIIPPALLMALQPSGDLLIRMLILILALGALQHVVLNVIAPKLFGHHTGVPTLVTFAALLFGARQGGVWGAFFAVPIIGVGWAMFEVFYERFIQPSPLFQNSNEPRSPDEKETSFVIEPDRPPDSDSGEGGASPVNREPVSPGSSGPHGNTSS
jgi:predicted PurR-regulated permease PerM